MTTGYSANRRDVRRVLDRVQAAGFRLWAVETNHDGFTEQDHAEAVAAVAEARNAYARLMIDKETP